MTVVLKSDGTVWTVGSNYIGQLGDGTTTARSTPVQVSGLTGIVAVASGGTTIRTPVRGIRHIGRDATGVTIMGVPEGEVVASVALILASEDEE